MLGPIITTNAREIWNMYFHASNVSLQSYSGENWKQNNYWPLWVGVKGKLVLQGNHMIVTLLAPNSSVWGAFSKLRFRDRDKCTPNSKRNRRNKTVFFKFFWRSVYGTISYDASRDKSQAKNTCVWILARNWHVTEYVTWLSQRLH